MTPNINIFVIFFASIFTSNIVLSNFLGLCSFISISKDIKASNGLGLAVTFVLTITTAICFVINKYILIPFELEYLQYIVFIIIIAGTVQILEMIIDRISSSLYMVLGIFLPLITVNCAILGVILFMVIRSYSFIQSVFFSIGSGLGWWIAIMLLAAIRKKIEKSPVIGPLKGTGITLIIIGIMAMAFMGFSGLLNIQ